jgi:hypothetical protein
MQYSPYDPWRKYALPVFDPLNVTAMALSGLGTGLSAANTIAGGNYSAEAGQMKQTEADFQATQDIQNAAGETAAAQRLAIGANRNAAMLSSSAVARAAAGGVNAGAGSALTDQAQIVGRGNFQAGMDLWQGQNRATGLLNQATAQQYAGYMSALSGDEARRRSYLDAASTIAGGGASIMRMYGGMPSNRPGGQMTWTDFGTGGNSYPMFN